MSIELIFRLIGLVAIAIVGVYYGITLSETFDFSPIMGAIILGAIGGMLGFFITPYITIRPAQFLRSLLAKIATPTLLAGLIGLIAGLIVATLSAFPLSLLPSPFGDLLPFFSVLIFSYLGIIVFVNRQNDLLGSLRTHMPGRAAEAAPGSETTPAETEVVRTILLDTSVIIDGRIAEIAQTGFLSGSLLIPRFVLNELQYIADSADNLRRQRGRRGMEVLSQLQKNNKVTVRISDIDVEGVREVDDKLVVLARQLLCPIMTNDYNLNRVAELQGVMVLNVNELANAVKSVLLPGETFTVSIIQEGRESGQGVAYLDDGTMVVVEDGRDYIGKQVMVMVTKVLQTAAGRMIFARMEIGN